MHGSQKNCSECNYEIGGKYVPKTTSKKRKIEWPESVLVVDSQLVRIYSVKLDHRSNRVFVLKDNTNVVCHHENCKESRAVHMASAVPFSCVHTAATEKSSEPLSAKVLTAEDIQAYKCDKATEEKLLQHLDPPEDFRHVVKVSEHSFAIFTEPSPSNPTGFCHVEMDGNGKLQCCNKNCNRKLGSGKQMKTKSICVHLHILLCILKIPEQQQEASCSSASSTAVDTVPDATDFGLSVSRTSSIKLTMTKTIPYPVPKVILNACRIQKSCPTSFLPQAQVCDLCESPLSDGQRHPGQGRDDLSYMLTPSIFQPVSIQVKFCSNNACKALHQAWPVHQGLFNICDKLLVAIEILVHWRELFKRGVPLTVAIESSLESWKKCGQMELNDNEQKYITGLLYNGFYAFELISERNMDDVICGISGVVGQVYFGDGNEKNCCSIAKIDYSQESDQNDEELLPSLESFLLSLKSVFVEKITFASSKQDNTVKAVRVPPIIAPGMRGSKTFNTEMKMKSVYLGGKFFEKDKINGDPMLLHRVIRSQHLDMTSLEKLTQQELRSICEECKIEKVSSLSKALLIQRLQSLYSSLLTGSSPCHGFTHVHGHTGGFYHLVCRHGTTVASKFLLLQESVRDAADLYLSLKYPPLLLVNDTPCGFARHLHLREPVIAEQFWGDRLGCFETPIPGTKPKEVSVPELVTAEFSSNKLEANKLKAGAALQHPLTQSTQRYVVGDRFHTSANPHKSQLCEFHNINLCLQRDTIKTSYQECQNNSKNLKRLRSATMQSFPVHFVYNFLMDFYHNEIVDRQRKRLSLSLKGGQELRRDEHHRFIVVNNN